MNEYENRAAMSIVEEWMGDCDSGTRVIQVFPPSGRVYWLAGLDRLGILYNDAPGEDHKLYFVGKKYTVTIEPKMCASNYRSDFLVIRDELGEVVILQLADCVVVEDAPWEA